MPQLDTSTFQSAFGRLCDLAARALHDGVDREQVRLAFYGEECHPTLDPIRAACGLKNAAIDALAGRGIYAESDLKRELVKVGRISRDAVQEEWMVDIPIDRPNP